MDQKNMKGFVHIMLSVFIGVAILASISTYFYNKNKSNNVDFQKNISTETPLATSNSSTTPSPKGKKYIFPSPTAKPLLNTQPNQNSPTTNNNSTSNNGNSNGTPVITPSPSAATNTPTSLPTSTLTPTSQPVSIQVWVRGWQYTNDGHQYPAQGNIKITNSGSEIASGSIGGDDIYKVSNMPESANLTVYFYLYNGCGQSKQLTTSANSTLYQVDFNFSSATSCL